MSGLSQGFESTSQIPQDAADAEAEQTAFAELSNRQGSEYVLRSMPESHAQFDPAQLTVEGLIKKCRFYAEMAAQNPELAKSQADRVININRQDSMLREKGMDNNAIKSHKFASMGNRHREKVKTIQKQKSELNPDNPHQPSREQTGTMPVQPVIVENRSAPEANEPPQKLFQPKTKRIGLPKALVQKPASIQDSSGPRSGITESAEVHVSEQNRSKQLVGQYASPKESSGEPGLQAEIPVVAGQIVRPDLPTAVAVTGQPGVEVFHREQMIEEPSGSIPETSYGESQRIQDLETEVYRMTEKGQIGAERATPDDEVVESGLFEEERIIEVAPLQEGALIGPQHRLKFEAEEGRGRAETILLGRNWWEEEPEQSEQALDSASEAALEPADIRQEVYELYADLQEFENRQLVEVTDETYTLAESAVAAMYDKEAMAETLIFAEDGEEIVAKPLVIANTNEKSLAEIAGIISLAPVETEDRIEHTEAAHESAVSFAEVLQESASDKEGIATVSIEEVEEAYGQLAAIQEEVQTPRIEVTEEAQDSESEFLEAEQAPLLVPVADIATTPDFETYVAARPEPEVAVTLEAIGHEADERPLLETLALLAELMEEPALEQDAEAVRILVQQIEEISAGRIKSADPNEKLKITPELTEKLLLILKTLGYHQPGEALVGFVAKYDLEYLLEVLEYLRQLSYDYNRYEFLANSVAPAAAADDTVRLRLGKLLFGLITNAKLAA